MTPMQKLKPLFDEFKSLLPLSVKDFSLNKAQPDYYVEQDGGSYEVHEKAGVKSDFIRIFQLKFNDKDSHNLGFVFSYLNLPHESHTITVSLKVGTREPLFLESKSLSVNDFKDLFLNIIKNIQSSKETNFLKMVDLFKNYFDLKQKHQKRPKKTKNIKF